MIRRYNPCALCAQDVGGPATLCVTCAQRLKRETEPPRLDLVAHVREQLRAGTYETPGKLRIVAEKLAKELRRDA